MGWRSVVKRSGELYKMIGASLKYWRGQVWVRNGFEIVEYLGMGHEVFMRGELLYEILFIIIIVS